MTDKQVDLQHIYGIAGGEEEFVIEIIKNFLAGADGKVEKVISDLQNKRSEDLHFDAHKLKGTFRYVGATRLGNMMEELEHKAVKGLAIENTENIISELR